MPRSREACGRARSWRWLATLRDRSSQRRADESGADAANQVPRIAGCRETQYTTVVSGIDYDSFRTKSWAERISLFNGITAEERAELVRTHMSRWLSLHRHELTDEQITIVEENIAFISTDLYASPPDEELISRYLELAKRTATLLSPDQAKDALTMSWDKSCATAAR